MELSRSSLVLVLVLTLLATGTCLEMDAAEKGDPVAAAEMCWKFSKYYEGLCLPVYHAFECILQCKREGLENGTCFFTKTQGPACMCEFPCSVTYDHDGVAIIRTVVDA